jgi:hypothetical protein
METDELLSGTELERLDRAGRLIKLDYPYRPRRRPLEESRCGISDLIKSGADRYGELLTEIATFGSFFERIPVYCDPANRSTAHWVNGWFPGLDAITLYGLLAIHEPRWYVEIGSGNSTMFARQAIRDLALRTSIISIDPYPRAEIDRICDSVLRMPCEEVPMGFFDQLSAEDVLFVDNSHRAFQNSDVTVFFTEILPNLPSRMIYGLHDIFLPWDYPEEWKPRFYNEQYLLATYLLGGARGDHILLPNAFISREESDQLRPLINTLESPKLAGIEKKGGAFWMRRA